jgi:hypothetical protein
MRTNDDRGNRPAGESEVEAVRANLLALLRLPAREVARRLKQNADSADPAGRHGGQVPPARPGP